MLMRTVSTLIALVAFHAPSVYGAGEGIHEANDAFGIFLISMSRVTDAVLSPDSPSGMFSSMLFFVIAVYYLGKEVLLWANGVVQLDALLTAVLMVTMVAAVLESYDYLTSLAFETFDDIAASIQLQMLGTEDSFAAIGYIEAYLDHVSIMDAHWLDGIKKIFAVMIATALIVVLGALAFLADAWAVWGYVLAKLLGWLFIPFIMIKPLSGLFDRWLSFFVGFLFYGLVVRINLAMIATMFSMHAGVSLDQAEFGPVPITWDGIFSNLVGALALLLIAILALISSGKFANQLASSVVATGGAAQAIRGVAVAGGKMI